MKYNCDVNINKPMEEVIKKFLDPSNLKHWQPGLISFEIQKGEPHKVGTESLFKFSHKGKEMQLRETIIVNNLPHEFSVRFDANGMSNIVRTYFSEVSHNSTKCETVNEFNMKGIMKYIGWMFKPLFKKQSMVFMNNLKAFVEEGKSVAK
jgi:hypothetical protein